MGLVKSARCEGSIIKASIREAPRAIQTTKGICFINLPIKPVIKIKGLKAAIVVRMVAKTGAMTSLVPLIAACLGSIPPST